MELAIKNIKLEWENVKGKDKQLKSVAMRLNILKIVQSKVRSTLDSRIFN